MVNSLFNKKLEIISKRVNYLNKPFIFATSVIPILLFFILFVPVGEAPDERTHILRVDSVRHFSVSGFRFDVQDALGRPAKDVGVRADLALLDAATAFPFGAQPAEKQETFAKWIEKRAIPWRGRREIASVPNTGIYPLTFYIPFAIGMEIARLADFGPYDSIIGARLFGAFSYVIIGALALSQAKSGRGMMFVLLCLPMTLYLASSVSQDGLTIAALCLSAALWTRDREDCSDPKRWLLGCAIFGLAAMAKPYIAPLAVVGWLRMPRPASHPWKSRVVGAVIMLGPAIVWSLAMAAFVSTPFLRSPTPAGPLWTGAPGTIFATTSPIDQLRVVLAHPVTLFRLFFDALIDRSRVLWHEAIGVFGPLQWPLPDSLYKVWSWIIPTSLISDLLSAERDRQRQGYRPLIELCVGLGACALSIMLVYVLQYLTWTMVGDVRVEGVQGRYLLPIIAAMIPVLSNPALHFPGAGAVKNMLSLPAAGMAMVGIMPAAFVILHAYYIR